MAARQNREEPVLQPSPQPGSELSSSRPEGACSEPGGVTHTLTGLAPLTLNTQAGSLVSSFKCFEESLVLNSVVISVRTVPGLSKRDFSSIHVADAEHN